METTDYSLVVAGDKNVARRIPIQCAQFNIGRSESCHLRPTSTQVSRMHCRIISKGDEITVEDLGSTFGTLVNGIMVSGKRTLKHGDELGVGPLKFRLVSNRKRHVPKDADVILADASFDADRLGKSVQGIFDAAQAIGSHSGCDSERAFQFLVT